MSTMAVAQFRQPRTDIVKYDYATYQGTPIKTGWLFDDETYKKLYTSYNAADSLIKAFEHYEKMMADIEKLNKKVIAGYDTRILEKDSTIAKNEKELKDLNDLLKKSNDNVEKFSKQFIHIGKWRIHKGTAFSVGVSSLVVGYLIGKF